MVPELGDDRGLQKKSKKSTKDSWRISLVNRKDETRSLLLNSKDVQFSYEKSSEAGAVWITNAEITKEDGKPWAKIPQQGRHSHKA